VIDKEVIDDILMGLAVAIVFASSVGVLVMRDVYAKLHYVTPGTLVAPVLVALAVAIREGYDVNSVQTWLALLFVVIAGPFLSHATIRAARIREKGDWHPGRSGGKPPEEEEKGEEAPE